jgi:inhibitor of KinA sporulation pathway (predicted exonuclease)
MIELRSPYLLVIDLEATCDENHRIPRPQTEIIEIGAVLVRADDLVVEGSFQTFVRPVVHRTITPFCTQLTSIAQADVANAPLFPAAIRALREFLGGRDALFCSWGDYDKNQLAQDAARHSVQLPLRGHLNLKRAFSDQLGDPRAYGLAGALRRVGLRIEGTHHRGIDDARNIARLLPWCLGRRAA